MKYSRGIPAIQRNRALLCRKWHVLQAGCRFSAAVGDVRGLREGKKRQRKMGRQRFGVFIREEAWELLPESCLALFFAFLGSAGLDLQLIVY
jgi:hypothetical protein